MAQKNLDVQPGADVVGPAGHEKPPSSPSWS
jgi:hypothetical protein